jgi:hypothetical protein
VSLLHRRWDATEHGEESSPSGDVATGLLLGLEPDHDPVLDDRHVAPRPAAEPRADPSMHIPIARVNSPPESIAIHP